MRRFVKGILETVVDDSDRRIPEYVASGWEEKTPIEKPQDEASQKVTKAIADSNGSEAVRVKSCAATNKKVNDAIKANIVATDESEEIDDGLFKIRR